MWISAHKWECMCQRVAECEKRIAAQEKMLDEKIMEMAKRLLSQPDELSKEIESQEAIEQFVDEFIQS